MTLPADHDKQNRQLKLRLCCVSETNAADHDDADPTGLVLFFGTNMLHVKRAWVKEAGNSLKRGWQATRDMGLP
jgi:hypothetical protein